MFKFFVLLLLTTAFSKNILFVSIPAHSHTHPLPGIASTLVGHNLYFAISEKFKPWTTKFNNSKFIPLESKVWEQFGISSGRDYLKHMKEVLMGNLIKGYEDSYDVLEKIFDQVKPDLVVMDMFQISAMDIAEKRKIPFILSTNGAPFVDRPFLPSFAVPKPKSQITIKDKLMKVVGPFFLISALYSTFSKFQEIRKRYSGLDVPMFPFHYSESHVCFYQSFIGLEYNIQYPSNFVFLGGYLDLNKNIDQDVKPVLEENLKKKQKTIFIAFGTVVLLHKWQIMNLVKGAVADPKNNLVIGMRKESREFSQVTKEELENLAKGRIRVFEWVNQQYVLSHPAVDLFVTHSGFQSTLEGIYNEKPMLAHPVFGDQPLNSVKIHDAGIGLYLNTLNYTVQDVSEKIQEILTNPKYKENVKKVNNLRKSYKLSRASDIIEDILLNGDSHYFTMDSKISFLERTGMDALLLVFFTLLFGFLVAKKILC